MLLNTALKDWGQGPTAPRRSPIVPSLTPGRSSPSRPRNGRPPSPLTGGRSGLGQRADER